MPLMFHKCYRIPYEKNRTTFYRVSIQDLVSDAAARDALSSAVLYDRLLDPGVGEGLLGARPLVLVPPSSWKMPALTSTEDNMFYLNKIG